MKAGDPPRAQARGPRFASIRHAEVGSALPDGMVTFLLTDIEGSVALWERDSAAARETLVRHDEIVQTVVQRCRGTLVRPRGEGDSFFIVFARPSDALTAAVDLQ